MARSMPSTCKAARLPTSPSLPPTPALWQWLASRERKSLRYAPYQSQKEEFCMQPQAVQKVLVAGGGIAGLVAAIALQRAGIDVTVFERVKEQQEVGAGLSLWANAIRALQKIGLTELLESVGKPLPRSCILSWQGHILSETPVETLAERYGTPLIVMHRADLQAALLQAIGEGVVQSGV